MSRYKSRMSAGAIERDFSHVVETVVPKGVRDQRSRSDIPFADRRAAARGFGRPRLAAGSPTPIRCNSEPAITGLPLRGLRACRRPAAYSKRSLCLISAASIYDLIRQPSKAKLLRV